MIERIESRRGTQRVITLVETGDGTRQQQRRLQPLQLNPQAFVANRLNQAAITKYQAHWAELHSQSNPTEVWFMCWLKRIPKFGCSCQSDFLKILDANPLRYDDFFAWSVEVHNSVNAKLSKPILTLEDAAKIWRKPTETTA